MGLKQQQQGVLRVCTLQACPACPLLCKDLMSPGVAADTWNSGGMVPLLVLLGSHVERAKAALKEPQSKQPDSFFVHPVLQRN